ncbi:MAG: flagellar brake protein [Burkholderiales bacterium]
MEIRSRSGPPTASDPFAVADAAERVRLLRRLLAEDAMVVLHLPGDEDTAVVSRLLSLDVAAGRIELEFVTDEGRRAAFRDAGRALARATLDGVGLRFELDAARTDVDGRLVASLPRRLARLQRREAYRVTPPVTAQPRLFVPVNGDEPEARILDISATGLAFEWPGPDAAPSVGTRLAGCRLELPATLPIRCALAIRSVEPRPGAPVRLGGELVGLDPAAARAGQVYVNLAQTRARRARARLC